MREKKNRLVILSLDAVGKRDMEFMLSLPNFSKFVSEGAFCDTVYSTYPSLTYPAHAAIISGRTPNHSRIVANTQFQPQRSNPDWLYKSKFINGKTLVDEAKKHGYKIAAFLWPVMGGADIDYNVPEVMVTRKLQNQVLSCLANGPVGYLLDMNKRFGHLRHGVAQPDLDDFGMAVTEYTIKKYDPDMILVHLTDVDTQRHEFGVTGQHVRKALERHDQRIGKLIEWLSETRPMEDTTFVILGDHCQVDMHTIVYLNKLFLDKGLLTVKNGKIIDYKVIAKTCDASTYVYMNPKYADDENLLCLVTDLLNEIKKNEELGIEEIFTSEEAGEMGADENCLVMIEGKPGYYFLNDFDALTESVKDTKNKQLFATHGCLPTKEENLTFFAAKGPGIKKGALIESMHLWDEGVTIAKLMGFNLVGADGKVITEMLEV